MSDARGLEIRDLSVELGGMPILSEVSAAIPTGSHTLIVGPSGSGKSTLLRAVAGLLRPSSGTISLSGETWSDARSGSFLRPQARKVGLVAQDLALWPGISAERQIQRALRWRGVPRAECSGETERLLALAGLGDRAHHRPDQLSGGEGQRLAIARALAGRSRLLLLDEPFGQLDVDLRQRLSSVVHAMAGEEGTTILHVTHDPRDALEHADGILALHEGRLVREGSPAALAADPGTAFVARALGFTNILPAELAERMAAGGAHSPALRRVGEGTVALAPWELELAGEGGAAVTLERVVPSGGRWMARVVCGDLALQVECAEPREPGAVFVRLRP